MDVTTEEEKKWKQSEKQFIDWENSIDGICYDMKTMAETNEYDVKDMALIAETLQRIPAKVRNKILGEAVFVFMNGLYGTVINGFFRKTISKKELVELPTRDAVEVTIRQPLIFLNFGLMKKLSKKRKMNTTAHEIAHFVLKHHLKPSLKINEWMTHEKEADDLIVKWGFEREYKSYKVK